MAYNILIAESGSSTNLRFDYCLGSAATVDLHWESVGRKLELPLISKITEKADYEGFVIDKDELLNFEYELILLAKFWKGDGMPSIDVPQNFIDDINEIIKATRNAYEDNLQLIIG